MKLTGFLVILLVCIFSIPCEAGFRCSFLKFFGNDRACRASCWVQGHTTGYCDDGDCVCTALDLEFTDSLRKALDGRTIITYVTDKISEYRENGDSWEISEETKDLIPARCSISDSYCETSCQAIGKMDGKCNDLKTDCECTDEKVSAKQWATCLDESVCNVYCQTNGNARGQCLGEKGWDCKCITIMTNGDLDYGPLRIRGEPLTEEELEEFGDPSNEVTTVAPEIQTFGPEDVLYTITTDYHWASINENATKIPGTWDKENGVGYGPFGFGTSVVLGDDTCMVDSDFLKQQSCQGENCDAMDKCQTNPINCNDGLSFSIWEKKIYEENPMLSANKDFESMPKKYIISNGAEFDRKTGEAIPGFSVYHQGVYLIAMVTTGQEVWEIKVAGQLHNNTWSNIGVRWEKPDLENLSDDVHKMGGLELYVNLNKVGHSIIPETTYDGTPIFEEIQGYRIDGKEPPVIAVGCHYDQKEAKFTHFGGAEYDEVALWSRRLGTNKTHDETVFFFGGFESKFEDVNPAQFKALLNNADLKNEQEAKVANDILEAMLLTPPTTEPPIPTRTPDPLLEKEEESKVVENSESTTSASEESSQSPADSGDNQNAMNLAKSQLTLQNVMTTMLNTDNIPIVRSPKLVEDRFPLSVVAAKIVSGKDSTNRAKWDAVYKYHKNEVGAPKTIEELEKYMLAWAGATNTSATEKTNYFDPKTQSMKYPISGDDFVMNVEKLQPSEFRKGTRKNYPNYSGIEWFNNNNGWGKPKDTWSIPTGLFKDTPGCNNNPVTFISTVYNKLGKTMPPRRNPAYIRSSKWSVDSRIISTGASANVNPMNYNENDVKTVSQCFPDLNYLKDNPIRAELYHKDKGKARLTRRLLSFFTNNEFNVGGIEVRHCARWNPKFGSNGAWDPDGCTLKSTDDEKTVCECQHMGLMAVIMERTEAVEIDDDCLGAMIFKYFGIVLSIISLLFFIFVTIGSKNVWDMFHVIRMNICVCWILGMIFYIATDFDSVRDDQDINVIIGFIMKYFYTASTLWIAIEAHSHFRAFTIGIINGRLKVYIPFGYGVPFIPLGLLFLLWNDYLGIDPRCFVGWNRDAKLFYLLFNLCISLVSVTFAIIIMFNLSKPQTKRRNLISDLTSQARGSVLTSFFTLILWIFATITYMHRQDSNMRDPYCLFMIYLGWFGVLVFIFLGFLSKKVRNGIRSKKNQEPIPAYIEETEETFDDTRSATIDTNSVISRPETATSVVFANDSDHSSTDSENSNKSDDSNHEESDDDDKKSEV